jgi:hypothetical protein
VTFYNAISGAGGILSPGNSYGKFLIDGNHTFDPGSYFNVEIDPGSGIDDVAGGTSALHFK